MSESQSLKEIYYRLRYGADGKAGKYARKVEQRKEKFESQRWAQGEDLAARNYENYEEYLKHQAEKLDKYLDRRRGKEDDEYAEFLRRFGMADEIKGLRTALCLGARLGTEVKALHEMGYFAIGIDLNPGPDNQWVCVGDFHKLVFPDESVDLVYTNTLDHVFELERVVAEIDRVLSPEGVFLTDVVPGFEEGFFPGEYESSHWRTVDALVERIEGAGRLQRVETRDLGVKKRDRWYQLAFKRPQGD